MSAERDLFGNELPQARAKPLKPEPKPKKAKEEKPKEERPKPPSKAQAPQAKVPPKHAQISPKPAPTPATAHVPVTPEREIVDGIVSYAKSLEEWADVLAKAAVTALKRAAKIRKLAQTQGSETSLDPEWSQRNADAIATAALNARNDFFQARELAIAAVAEYRRMNNERKS